MLSGLNKEDLFDIILEFALIGNDKYTVSNGEWTVKKDAAEPFNGGNLIKLFNIIFSGLWRQSLEHQVIGKTAILENRVEPYLSKIYGGGPVFHYYPLFEFEV